MRVKLSKGASDFSKKFVKRNNFPSNSEFVSMVLEALSKCPRSTNRFADEFEKLVNKKNKLKESL